MPHQGPILVVAAGERPPFAMTLDDANLFPVVETDWRGAVEAINKVRPAAVIAAMADADASALAEIAIPVAQRQPYLPLIAVDPTMHLPDHAIPYFQEGSDPQRLIARLKAALRIRSLHATVMRRLTPAVPIAMTSVDPSRDATVLLIGRGNAYPALSVALGERTGVVGALSIEAAAKHLNNRDIDGIVLGEGFSPRVVDAFLTVLAEDARFRNLPVVVNSGDLVPNYDLPQLEIISGDAAQIAAIALPLVRQHAFESHLGRTLSAINAEGLIDPRTGLLTSTAFEREFATAIYQTTERGGALSVARFAFDPEHPRARFDCGRIISRLMRQMDFGAVLDDGSVVVVLAGAELRNAHMVARRLSSVMRHTSLDKRGMRAEPVVTVSTLMPNDTAKTLLGRLYDEAQRAAS